MTDDSFEQSPTRHTDETKPLLQQSSNNPDFDYPAILLQASFESLISHSFPSTSSSSTARMADLNRPISSLSESWTSLSNSAYTPEDDLQSESNDAGSLIDVNGSEDVHSFDERDDSSESGLPSLDVDESIAQLPGQQKPAANDDARAGYQSTTVSQSQDLESIEFDEPEHWPEVGHIDVKHTLKVFEDDESERLRESLQGRAAASQLVGTIRMTMSKNGLPLHQPFRILYNGRPAARELRAEILQTLAVALVASGDMSSYHRSTESSRYHVIPSSFGPGASSDYATMVPIQTQLIVDECIDATSLEDSSGQEQIILSLKNGDVIHSRWDGIWQNVQERRRWTRPDVAVFLACEETDSSSQGQITRLMHECMLRHNVPTLVINDEASWSAWSQSLALDPQSFHRCIEGRSSSLAGGRVFRRLPIDLDTFTNLDPEQLNKHLACLNDIAQSRIAAAPKGVSFTAGEARPTQPAESLNDVEKNMSRSYMAQHQDLDLNRPLTKLREYLMFITLVIALVGWMLAASPLRHGRTESVTSGPSTTAASVITAVPLTTSVPVDSVMKTSAPAKSSPVNSPAIRGKTDLARLLSDPFLDLANKSDKFQVEVIGDCHIVVKSPQAILQKRKEPRIQYRVTRGNETLNVQVSTLFYGVYSVKIERAEAYGPLNLTIIVAKPSINETIELDFGSPWLKMASWDKARKRLLTQVLRDIDLSTVRLAFQSIRDNSKFYQYLSASNLKEASARAQESWNQLAGNVRLLAEDARIRSIKQQKFMAEHMARAHGALQTMVASSEVAQDRAREHAEAAASSVKQYLENVRNAVSQVELPDIRNKLMDIARSDTMAKAQDRAQKIIRDSADKIRQHRQEAKSRRWTRSKKRCKKCSRK